MISVHQNRQGIILSPCFADPHHAFIEMRKMHFVSFDFAQGLSPLEFPPIPWTMSFHGDDEQKSRYLRSPQILSRPLKQ